MEMEPIKTQLCYFVFCFFFTIQTHLSVPFLIHKADWCRHHADLCTKFWCMTQGCNSKLFHHPLRTNEGNPEMLQPAISHPNPTYFLALATLVQGGSKQASPSRVSLSSLTSHKVPSLSLPQPGINPTLLCAQGAPLPQPCVMWRWLQHPLCVCVRARM